MKDWIARGMLPLKGQPGQEPLVWLRDESHFVAEGYASGMYVLQWQGDNYATEGELAAARRTKDLEGLVWTDVDADALAVALADALDVVAPELIEVRVDRGMLWIGGAGVDVAGAVSDDERDPIERVRDVGERTLDVLSDEMAEETGEPWPARAGLFSDGFPPIDVSVADGLLKMRYGTAELPVLELPPVKVGEVLKNET